LDLHLTIDPGAPATLRAQLEQQLRDGVRSGRLRPGTRLPASRTLADELGLSRGVVVEAYAQLVAEGYLAARQGAGTEVAAGAQRAGGPVPAARRAREQPPLRYDFRIGLPDLSAFPRRAWLQAAGRALRAAPDAALGYGDPRGAIELRVALAAYLGRARGTVADPERMLICAGQRQGIHLVCAALRARGAERVAIEDAGWEAQRDAVVDAGLTVVPVPVDEDGMRVDALERLGADAAVLTPANQFPTGAVLAPERRARLVAWARREGGLVIEDDYDAEFRYDREPVGALQGLAPDRVAYSGSASKTLAPALRLAWLLLPAWLADAATKQKARADGGSPLFDQLTLADFLAHGELDRHLRRLRLRYRRRRDALAAALARHLPEVTIEGVAAGLHAVVRLPDDWDEEAIIAAARERGLAINGFAERSFTGPPPGPTLLLGYANLPESAAEWVVAELARAVRAVITPPTRRGAPRSVHPRTPAPPSR
jgi:GntR family transcriptional regulator/MocR family aminotransferase